MNLLGVFAILSRQIQNKICGGIFRFRLWELITEHHEEEGYLHSRNILSIRKLVIIKLSIHKCSIRSIFGLRTPLIEKNDGYKTLYLVSIPFLGQVILSKVKSDLFFYA